MQRLPCDPLTLPLSGRTLIEASAGTGKTFTLALIVLRLLLEKGLALEQILVVTFTEAATEELRERIRLRLRQACDLCAGREGEPDPLLAEIIDRIDDRHLVWQRLRKALLDIDRAAIHTIHGYCQRLLSDHAVAAGALFDGELLRDATPLHQELADDFWRRRLPNVSPRFAGWLAQRKIAPESLAKLLPRRSPPEIPILCAAPIDEAAATVELEQHLDQLNRAWQKRSEIMTLLQEALPQLNGQSYKSEKLLLWEEELTHYLAGASPLAPCKALEMFSASTLIAKTKKGKITPQHPFFDLCDLLRSAQKQLEKACETHWQQLQLAFLDFAEAEAERRKQQRNLRTFDDLLLSVRSALQQQEGGLAENLRRCWPAALIDEFQDTDPVQYAIFSTLYPDATSTLFFIGDPKQAIYSFRGADIFAYLRATQQVERCLTLGMNFRSNPDLVTGVNSLFGVAPSPFLLDEIPFTPVEAPVSSRWRRLVEHGKETSPLHLWFVDRSDTKLPKQGVVEERLKQAVCGEIVRLLQGGESGEVQLQEDETRQRPLRPGDIAILVRTHRQGRLLQEALRQVNVPAVCGGTDSLFASDEAQQLLQILSAIAHPAEESLLRGALLTPLFGLDAAILLKQLEDEPLWEAQLERFAAAHHLWQHPRIVALAGFLFENGETLARLLRLRDGERRLTNLRHLLELLHLTEREEGRGMEGVLAWLKRQLHEKPDQDEMQLRLESDADAVQIVTIHRSKGLEYPVVFLPFCAPRDWDRIAKGEVVFHAEAPDTPLCLDLGSDDVETHRALYLRELQAEELRLFYVAATRARQRCYIAWGAVRGSERGALSWLLHPTPETTSQLLKQEDAVLLAPLQHLANTQPQAIAVQPLPQRDVTAWQPAPESSVTLTPRLFTPPSTMTRSWRIASFTALSAHSAGHGEGEAWRQAEREESPAADAPPLPVENNIHAFPKGARPGTCLHEIFEQIDFVPDAAATRRQEVRSALARHGIEPHWEESVARMLEQTLAAPLVLQEPSFTLSTLAPEDRLCEMEFFFPLADLDPARLATLYRQHRTTLPEDGIADDIAHLTFAPLQGMMRGFADLIFCHAGLYYLLDWKSNHLGDDVPAYHPQALLDAMRQHCYILQYHLYTVALHLLLQQRLPGYSYQKHFGGVFYLFLRGIDPQRGDYGIFRDRPDETFIAELATLLRP